MEAELHVEMESTGGDPKPGSSSDGQRERWMIEGALHSSGMRKYGAGNGYEDLMKVGLDSVHYQRKKEMEARADSAG